MTPQEPDFDSGPHCPYIVDKNEANEDALPRQEFNQAMKSMNMEMRHLRDDLAGIKSLMQAQVTAKIAEAKLEGQREIEIKSIQEKLDNFGKVFIGVAISVGGLAIWKFVELVGKK